jgi:PleD family two-component response regulator
MVETPQLQETMAVTETIHQLQEITTVETMVATMVETMVETMAETMEATMEETTEVTMVKTMDKPLPQLPLLHQLHQAQLMVQIKTVTTTPRTKVLSPQSLVLPH